MFFCYILYSQTKDTFYIGYTHDKIEVRLASHNSAKYENSYTSKTNDWKLFFSIECTSQKQALNIEKHIKRMKSRKYIQNLTIYPEISQKLLLQYLA